MNRPPRRSGPFLALLFAVVAGLVSPFAGPDTASAHPLGNFTINRYARLDLHRGEVTVHYVLDFAEIPAFQLKQEADTNSDDILGLDEIDAILPGFAEDVAGKIALDVDGTRVGLAVTGATGTVSNGQGSLDVIRIALVLRGATATKGLAEVQLSDANYADRPGWREIVVRPSAGTAVEVDDAFLVERSDALRAYPEDSLDSTPTDSALAFRWDPATGTAAPAAAIAEAAPGETSRGDRFSRLLEHDRSLGIVVLSLVAAFGFGALHALGPGHGKSVVAAYLVGSKGTPRQALALGITVTATHTAAVYGLGFITLVASGLIAPDRLFLYLGVVSGALIAVMGLTLFASRLRSLLRPKRETGLHRHGLFRKQHSHLPVAHNHGDSPHLHDRADGHDHGHGHTDDGRDHAAKAVHPRVTWRGLLTLGVAGGIIPCPSALVVMLAAISLGQVVFGMLLIVAFSFGLAGVLVAIGLALVLGRRLSGRVGRAGAFRRPAFARALGALPVLSALGVTVAGLAITYQAWNQPGL